MKLKTSEKFNLLKATTLQQTRYNLSVVHLDVETQILSATDGRIAAFWPVTVEPSDVSGTIPREAIRQLLRSRLSRRASLLCEQEWCVFAAGTDKETRYLRSDQRACKRYPDTAATIPEVTGPATITLDARRLLEICEALGGDGPVNLWVGETGKPYFVTPGYVGHGAYGLLMPMRTGAQVPPVIARAEAAKEVAPR